MSIEVCKATLDELRAEVAKLERARSFSAGQSESYRLQLEEVEVERDMHREEVAMLRARLEEEEEERRGLLVRLDDLEAGEGGDGQAEEELRKRLEAAADLNEFREREKSELEKVREGERVHSTRALSYDTDGRLHLLPARSLSPSNAF